MTLDPAVAAIRLAVRRELTILAGENGGTWSPDFYANDGTAFVACSGGADSLALLSATIFELRQAPVKVVGVTVDHGLQDGSAERAEQVVAQMAALGADQTAAIRVTVDVGPGGIEAGAREARYAALSQLAEQFPAEQVLLGHTMDDQAETVLLGLARGSGGRSLQGMRRGFYYQDPSSGPERSRPTPMFRRPLLDITRAQTETACRVEGITWWDDPHNTDPRFARSRVRHTVLPMLEAELGPGIAAALARTADSLREDVSALDRMAEFELQQLRVGEGLNTSSLETFDGALKSRVIRLAAIEAGASASELTRDHVMAVAAIVYGGRDARQIQLPGHITAYREGDLLLFRSTVTP